jgi:trimeric autotransporter adhesin
MGHPTEGEPFDYESLVRWNGTTTEVITVAGSVSALAVRDGMLYAGGYFSAIDGVAASNVARWDGTEWQALGAGVTGPNADPQGGYVTQLSFSGDDLYVGGAFASAGGQIAHSLAIWHEEPAIVVPPPTRLFLPILVK